MPTIRTSRRYVSQIVFLYIHLMCDPRIVKTCSRNDKFEIDGYERETLVTGDR